MQIVRSVAPESIFDPGITDAHIEAAIQDPARFVEVERSLGEQGIYYRIYGYAYPSLKNAQRAVVFQFPHGRIEQSLLRIAYVLRGKEAFVIHAVEADEEELETYG